MFVVAGVGELVCGGVGRDGGAAPWAAWIADAQ